MKKSVQSSPFTFFGQCEARFYEYLRCRNTQLRSYNPKKIFNLQIALLQYSKFLETQQALTSQQCRILACGYLVQAELSFSGDQETANRRLSYFRYHQALEKLSIAADLNPDESEKALQDALKIEIYISLGQRGIVSVERDRKPQASNIDLRSTKWFDMAMEIAHDHTTCLYIQLFKSKFIAGAQNLVEAYSTIFKASKVFKKGVHETLKSDVQKLTTSLKQKMRERYNTIMSPSLKKLYFNDRRQMYMEACDLAVSLQYSIKDALEKLRWFESYNLVRAELEVIRSQYEANSHDCDLITQLLNKHVTFADLCLKSFDRDTTGLAYFSTKQAKCLLDENAHRLDSVLFKRISKSIGSTQKTTGKREKVYKFLVQAETHFTDKNYNKMLEALKKASACVQERPLYKMIVNEAERYHQALTLQEIRNSSPNFLSKPTETCLLTDKDARLLSLKPENTNYSTTIEALSSLIKRTNELRQSPIVYGVGEQSIFRQAPSQFPVKKHDFSCNSGGGVNAKQG